MDIYSDDDNSTPNHNVPAAKIIARSEKAFISQLTSELFCNSSLKPLCLAALRDPDVETDKLYDLLRHGITSLALFIKAEDRALRDFAEALQVESIADGIASAVVAHAKEVLELNNKSAAIEDPGVEDLASIAHQKTDDDNVPATVTDRPPRPQPARPTFQLASSVINEILAREAYIVLTPTFIQNIIDSKRYAALCSQVRGLPFEAHLQRLSAVIGHDVFGEDGETLRWSRLRTSIDELAVTPARLISAAAYGTKQAEVTWSSPRRNSPKMEAPALREGYCRLKWTSDKGFVRFIDVREEVVRSVWAVIDDAPRIDGYRV